jgi:hypothetical protein
MITPGSIPSPDQKWFSVLGGEGDRSSEVAQDLLGFITPAAYIQATKKNPRTPDSRAPDAGTSPPWSRIERSDLNKRERR